MFDTKSKTLNMLVIFSIPFFIFGIWSIFLGKDMNWDLRNYHFYNGYSFLENRLEYDYFPAQIQTFLNPVMDVPLYLMIRFLPDKLTGFMIGGFQGTNMSVLILISYQIIDNSSFKHKSLQSKLLLLFIVLTGIFSPIFLSQIGTTFGDNITSFFVLFGVLIIIRDRNNKLCLLMSSIFFGLAAGLKLTNLIYCIATVITVFVIEPKSIKGKLASSLESSIGIILGILLTGGYWMLLMLVKYGNPIFPFYNNFFKSSYWSTNSWEDKRWLPESFLEGVSYIFRWTSKSTSIVTAELPFRDTRWLIILFVLLTLVICKLIVFLIRDFNYLNFKKDIKNSFKTLNHNELYIIMFSLVSFVIWIYKFSIHRYIIPLELISGLLIFILIDIIKINLNIKVFLFLTLSILIILTTIPPNWGRTSWNQFWFEINIPHEIIKSPDDTTIVIVSRSPVSYIIPFFPEQIRFVRLESNMNINNSLSVSPPEPENKLLLNAEHFVSNHKGNIFVLSSGSYPINDYDSYLKSKYNLNIDYYRCDWIVTNIEKLSICPANK